MSFPLEKYTFVYVGNKVIAISTYAGKIVKGVAKCSSEDEYDIQKGRELAAARCNAKVALKRGQRARNELRKALKAKIEAEKHYYNMMDYYSDAVVRHEKALKELVELEEIL